MMLSGRLFLFLLKKRHPKRKMGQCRGGFDFVQFLKMRTRAQNMPYCGAFCCSTEIKEDKMAEQTYTEKDFQRKSPFAGFLPGIAGRRGIPVWCMYVNRGQGVVSFGIENKDRAIMEFYPAHAAYEIVTRKGFRTFLRADGVYLEPFADPAREPAMTIHPNRMSVAETEDAAGLRTEASYYVLPEEPLGALVREVRITNISDHPVTVEAVDGMPAVIPYGVGMDSMKNMTETTKAWMQTEFPAENAAFCRVRASMEDSAEVHEVNGGVFAFAVASTDRRLPVLTDPFRLFSYDTGFESPVGFLDRTFAELLAAGENHVNEVPCAFFLQEKTLKPHETMEFHEVYGEAATADILLSFLDRHPDGDYFTERRVMADGLTDEITAPASCRTADPVFDAYVKSCYLDNGLRGGFPVPLGHNKIFYLYSRKHGDLERDYNYFSMLPEYYSQGNGNFRDVCQNRREDVFFHPEVGRTNIRLFYSLLQPDGYNPLSIEKETFSISAAAAETILSDVPEPAAGNLLTFLKDRFTPGALLMQLTTEIPDHAEELFTQILDFSEGGTEGSFGEGYWCDHWTYLLDLIEEYLLVFPEKEEELLTEEGYTYFAPEVRVNPRRLRYEVTDRGVRQYHALAAERLHPQTRVYTDRNGKTVEDSLLAHLLLLSAVKFATLDPYAEGIEMEGGKPGWYDALNGLPGMIGSSMCETAELLRLLNYLTRIYERGERNVSVPSEVGSFLHTIDSIVQAENEALENGERELSFWNRIGDAREAYREEVYSGFSGERTILRGEETLPILRRFRRVLVRGMEKARKNAEDVFPTYFSYEMTRFAEEPDGIHALDFQQHPLPRFLEGSVHALKVLPAAERQELYEAVRHSPLYDRALGMYKVNADLSDASVEIGRCRSFTPGWLENESVFLHMAYKYLLETEKSSLFPEFFRDFHQGIVAFMDPEVYGRSTLENSSFIASSANPDLKIRGKGYVARLSGSTVEFLSMWRRIMFGEKPFGLNDDGELTLAFRPAMPAYLIPEDGIVHARFLGSCDVEYHFSDPKKDQIPAEETVTSIRLTGTDGAVTVVQGGILRGQLAEDVRNGRIREAVVCI